VAPDRIMQFVTGAWATAILGSAARYGVFNALADGSSDAAAVAVKTGISVRGAQALLDGLTGMGLVLHEGGRYQNSPEASQFLVKGGRSYLGGMADVFTASMADWGRLPDAVKTGEPAAANTTDVPDNDFWQLLVPAIAGLSLPV